MLEETAEGTSVRARPQKAGRSAARPAHLERNILSCAVEVSPPNHPNRMWNFIPCHTPRDTEALVGQTRLAHCSCAQQWAARCPNPLQRQLPRSLPRPHLFPRARARCTALTQRTHHARPAATSSWALPPPPPPRRWPLAGASRALRPLPRAPPRRPLTPTPSWRGASQTLLGWPGSLGQAGRAAPHHSQRHSCGTPSRGCPCLARPGALPGPGT